MQVKEIILKEERLDEIAVLAFIPWILKSLGIIGGFIARTIVIGTGLAITEKAAGEMINLWTKWKLKPHGDAIPHRTRLTTTGPKGNKVKYEWNARTSSWLTLTGKAKGKTVSTEKFASRLATALEDTAKGKRRFNFSKCSKDAIKLATYMAGIPVDTKKAMLAHADLKKYQDWVAEKYKPDSVSRKMRFFSKIAPFTLIIAPIASFLTYALTARELATNYYYQYKGGDITKEVYAQRIKALRTSAVAFYALQMGGLGAVVIGAMLFKLVLFAAKGIAGFVKIAKGGKPPDVIDKAMAKALKAKKHPGYKWLFLSAVAGALVPVAMTTQGKQAISHLLTEFTFWGFFEGSIWESGTVAVRDTLVNVTNTAMEHMVTEWFEYSYQDLWGEVGLADPNYQTAVGAAKAGEKIDPVTDKPDGSGQNAIDAATKSDKETRNVVPD